MEPNEKNAFRRYLSESTHYFEYGSGGSTYWACQHPNIRTVTSVENDIQWATKIQKACPRAFVRFVDLGPVKPGGTPIHESTKPDWHLYYDAIRTRQVDPDLILVDGRWRVACTLTAAMEVPDATFLIHDYTFRPSYHVVTKYLEPIETIETLVAFRVKEDIDPSEVIQYYKYDTV